MNKVSGVYAISNSINNKIYIGASTNIYKRWIQHKSNLVHNRHSNKHLQNAFRKYGEVAFKYIILEEVWGQKQLQGAKQQWIDNTQCCKSEKGYNINSATSSTKWNQPRGTRAVKSKMWLVTDPTGKTLRVQNLPSFCIEHKLNVTCMRDVAKGKIKQHRGWICNYINPNKRQAAVILRERIAPRLSFLVTSPNNETLRVQNLPSFCIEHKLNVTCMRRVADGKSRYHWGWKCGHVDEKRRQAAESLQKMKQKGFLVTDPRGHIFHTENLKRFCKTKNLNYNKLRGIAQGSNVYYKGWYCNYVNKTKQNYAEILHGKRGKNENRGRKIKR
jgi:group I intron endonuclease